MTNNDFWENIPQDCEKAIKELKKLKVFNLCGFDYEETFTDVWWLVLHEVDLYVEGEYGQGEGFIESDPTAMNIRSARSADKWLIKWWDLANKYSFKEYYSEYYFKVHSGFGDNGLIYYGGQVEC